MEDRVSRMTPLMFYGASEDGSVGVNLYRYENSKTGDVVLTGTITDNVNDMTYEVRMGDSFSSYRIYSKASSSYPIPGDPIPPDDVPTIDADLIINDSDVFSCDATSCSSDDMSAVDIDVAIMYTATAECDRSFPNMGGVCT